MKTAILAASLLALSCSAMATNVGVSVTVGQPGFYGRLDLGDFGPPPVLYQQPIIVQRPARYVPVEPIYLRVPPGHARHWSKHCRAYGACGRPVLFVQDSWYVNEYAPRYRERHGPGPRWEGHGPGPRHERFDDRRDDHGRGHDRGPGNGHGRGHDNDHGPGRH
ncbi:hypothetical protein ACLB1G_05580 [Oxalobacteraceae bacterium A2-2]